MASASANTFGGSALGKFGAPDVSLGHVDPGRALKLAEKVEQTLRRCLNPEPRSLAMHLLLVAPEYRDGAPPNVQYIHHGTPQSLQKAGFDRTRPQVGVCVRYSTSAGKERLFGVQQALHLGEPLEAALYGTLAGTHLNLALRIIQSGVASLACDIRDLAPFGSSLHEVVHAGHKWWILPEDMPSTSLVEISLWRNQDQNENQSLHEVELLRNLMATCRGRRIAHVQAALGIEVRGAALASRRSAATAPGGVALQFAAAWAGLLTAARVC